MKGDTCLYAHALNIAIAHDMSDQKTPRAYFIEPQNDDIYLAESPKLPFGVDEMIIRKVLI